jgi:hypothetical protein
VRCVDGVKGRWEDPDTGHGERVKGRIAFGDGTGAKKLKLRHGGTFTARHTYRRKGKHDVTVTLVDRKRAVGRARATETIRRR